MYKVSVILFAIFGSQIAIGCTSYQPMGLTGGYSEVPLAKGVYHIQAAGNAYARSRKVNAILYTRAAVLAKEKGYDRILISEFKQDVIQNISSDGNTYGAATTSVYGNTAYTSYSGYGGGVTTNNKPIADLVVRFLSTTDREYPSGLLVEDVIASYGPIAGYKPEG